MRTCRSAFLRIGLAAVLCGLAGLVWASAPAAAGPHHPRGQGALVRAGLPPAVPAAAVEPRLQPPRNRSTPFHQSLASPLSTHRLMGFLAGGVLATLLWSRIFGYPTPAALWEEAFPFGLLDLAVLFALGYLGFRLYRRTRPGEEDLVRRRKLFMKPVCPGPVTLTVHPQAMPGLQEISRKNPDFDLPSFGDYACRVIATLHNAWNREELDALTGLLAPTILDYLRLGQKVLHLREEVSRLEELRLHTMEVTRAGRNGTGEFLTLRLVGEVTDYIMHRSRHQVLAGSLTTPAPLEEEWTFERNGGSQEWRVKSIDDLAEKTADPLHLGGGGVKAGGHDGAAQAESCGCQ
ncbi:MAG: Tim44 domain-containing protein [Deltaproteobacteria bacterium]|nr:Tim44 domain-containing protein [Deltaproteobacteria bacterium]